jgi:hypothetical protein
MKLKDLHFNPIYNSITEDVIADFYRPALASSRVYKRASAYFDSNILSLYSSGIESIVEKKGHIYFIFSDDIPEKDFEDMKKGYENRKDIEQSLIDRVTTTAPTPGLCNLAYLISIGLVDIKIAFSSTGIFHDKFGLIYDDNDVLCFRGSNNETAASAVKNFESFVTTCSWDASNREKDIISATEKEFDDLWNDRYPRTVVLSIPEAVKAKIVSYSQGHMVLNTPVKDNCLTLSLDENKQIIAYNNLNNPQAYSSALSYFASHIAPYIEKQAGKIIVFQKTLSIPLADALIANTKKIADAVHFNLYIDPILISHLDEYRLKMENLRNLGVAIKRKSELLKPSFDEFKAQLAPLMSRPLMEEQAWGSFHIVNMKRSANFSVPGAGKTAIVLGAFAYLENRGLVNRIVMVGPLNSFRSWKYEFHECFGDKKELRVFDYQLQAGNQPAQRFDSLVYKAKTCNLVLINYESLPRNVDALSRLIDDKTMLVFDEVHRVKGVEGIRAAAALSLCRYSAAQYRVVLTGTPIPNGFADTYNFLHILFPDQYESVFTYSVSELKQCDQNAALRRDLNDKLFPFFCITTKEMLKVPPADPDDLTTGYCLADSKDEKLYEIVRRVCSDNPLLMYVRLMQASCNPALILKDVDPEVFDDFYDPDDKDSDSGEFSDAFKKAEKKKKEVFSPDDRFYVQNYGFSPKFYKGIDIIKSEIMQGHNIIAWGIFISTLEKIKHELRRSGIACEVIDGQVPLLEREAILDKFQSGEINVLIANPATLAESVSLHKNCHVAIYFEYSFNLVHLLQSKDRIHRLGLPAGTKTHYYFMIMDNPQAEYQCIDMKILQRLAKKANLQKEAVTNDQVNCVPGDLEEEIADLVR